MTTSERLAMMTSASVDPGLTGDELAALIDAARVPDAQGRDVDSAGYVTTILLARAAAEGWRWKAAKLAARVDFSDEAARVARSQAMTACLAMADRYGRMVTGSVTVGVGATRRLDGLAGWDAILDPIPYDERHEGPPYLSPHVIAGAGRRLDNTV